VQRSQYSEVILSLSKDNIISQLPESNPELTYKNSVSMHPFELRTKLRTVAVVNLKIQ
jgi:hypothetical protein